MVITGKFGWGKETYHPDKMEMTDECVMPEDKAWMSVFGM